MCTELILEGQKRGRQHGGRGCPGSVVTLMRYVTAQVFLAWSDVAKWCQIRCLCKARDRISTAGTPTLP